MSDDVTGKFIEFSAEDVAGEFLEFGRVGAGKRDLGCPPLGVEVITGPDGDDVRLAEVREEETVPTGDVATEPLLDDDDN